MNDAHLFWFRTRQSLLEEWGYTPGLWHLVSRSPLSMVIIGINAAGQPRYTPSGALSEHEDTRVPLAIVNTSECELLGPFTPDRVPLPDESLLRRAQRVHRSRAA
jgi:hypothetical protein